jgi:predicted DNA-binding transcriptional regulator YafY
MIATEVAPDTFERPDDFDVVGFLRQSIGAAVYGTRCEVLLDLTIDEARHRVSPTDGTLEAVEDGTVLRFSADDLEWAAGYLAGLECDLVVLRPAALRTSLRTMAVRLRAAARRPAGGAGRGRSLTP